MAKSTSKLPEIDFSDKHRTTLFLRSDIAAYLASVSAGNQVTATEVINDALSLMRLIGKMGVDRTLHLAPQGNETDPSVVLLTFDPSNAVFSRTDYAEALERQRTTGDWHVPPADPPTEQ